MYLRAKPGKMMVNRCQREAFHLTSIGSPDASNSAGRQSRRVLVVEDDTRTLKPPFLARLNDYHNNYLPGKGVCDLEI